MIQYSTFYRRPFTSTSHHSHHSRTICLPSWIKDIKGKSLNCGWAISFLIPSKSKQFLSNLTAASKSRCVGEKCWSSHENGFWHNVTYLSQNLMIKNTKNQFNPLTSTFTYNIYIYYHLLYLTIIHQSHLRNANRLQHGQVICHTIEDFHEFPPGQLIELRLGEIKIR